ncbi:MAG: nucleotide sugar dehydrogenase [Candidatus Odinarchaeia archaeon]
MKICVLGLGYIGLPTACLLANSGFEIVGVDINKKVINTLSEGGLPFTEKGLDNLFKSARKNMVFKYTPEPADVFLIAVPTPLDKETKIADLSYVRDAVKSITKYVDSKTLVILESTVPPGTSENIVSSILNAKSLIAYCPERAIPGNTLYEMVNNDRIIGCNNDVAGKAALDIYSRFVKGKIYLTNLRTAEMVKLMENTYRDINIALANELAQIAEEINVNIWNAIELANKHDPWFLIESSVRSRIINTAREINDSMPGHVLRLVKSLGVKPPATITVWGVSYKGNVDDTRETPALKFIKIAENEGYKIKIYDPFVKEFEFPILDINTAVRDSHCIVLIADHYVFKEIDPKIIAKLVSSKNIVDTRNLLDHTKWADAGFNFKVLGRV